MSVMLYAIKRTTYFVLLAGFVAAISFSSSSSGQTQTANTRPMQPHQVTGVSAADPSAPKANANEILGNAHTIYVWSRTVFVKQEVIESALLGRSDFRKSGLLITKDGSTADLVLTVRRANFTTEYPYDVVDQKSGLVVAGGKVNSLFGTAAGKIAKGFMKQLQRARSVQDR